MGGGANGDRRRTDDETQDETRRIRVGIGLGMFFLGALAIIVWLFGRFLVPPVLFDSSEIIGVAIVLFGGGGTLIGVELFPRRG